MKTLNYRVRSAALIAAAAGVFIGAPAGFPASGSFNGQDRAFSDAMAERLMEQTVEYREQRMSVNEEIADIQENLDWLTLRILELRQAGRYVPEKMEASVEFKKGRIEALTETRKVLDERLEALAKQTSAMAGPVPDNGRVHEAEILEDPGRDVDMAAFEAHLKREINEAGLGDWLDVITSDGCCRLKTTLPILFASGSAVIADEYKPFFESLAGLIKRYDVRVLIDGYADIDGINTSRYPSNFELGAARAANVVHALTSHGVKPSVFQIGTTGRYRFEARGMSDTKTLERRADVTVLFAGNKI